MTDFRLWSRIEQLGPGEFFVVVTAIRADDPEETKSITRMSASREAALDEQRHLLIEVGAAIEARGDRVVDAETD